MIYLCELMEVINQTSPFYLAHVDSTRFYYIYLVIHVMFVELFI